MTNFGGETHMNVAKDAGTSRILRSRNGAQRDTAASSQAQRHGA
jgi:hypothetical protein